MAADSTKLIYECIKEVVNSLKKTEKNIGTPQIVPVNYKRAYKISRWDFLWFLANFVNNNSSYLKELKIPTYMDLVYALAGVENKCSDKVDIDSVDTVYFTDQLKNNLKTDSYCSYLLGFKNHANMLFIDNTDSKEYENTIDLYLYEPHGSNYIHEHADTFLKTIKREYNSKNNYTSLNIVDYKKTSTPAGIGIQRYIPEYKENRRGYCLNYSYFWLYLILHCSKTLPNIPLETIIKNIELSLLRILFSQEKTPGENISNTIHSFVNKIMDNFLHQTFTTLKDPKKQKELVQKITAYIINIIYLDELKYPIINLEDSEEPYHQRKNNNEQCDNDEECSSGNCVKGYCKPYERQQDGIVCSKDDDCLSSYCYKKNEKDELGKCQPYFNFSRKPRKSARKSARKPRKSAKKPRKSARKPRKSKSPKKSRKPRKSKKSRKPRKSLRKSKSPKKSRKPRKSRKSAK